MSVCAEPFLAVRHWRSCSLLILMRPLTPQVHFQGVPQRLRIHPTPAEHATCLMCVGISCVKAGQGRTWPDHIHQLWRVFFCAFFLFRCRRGRDRWGGYMDWWTSLAACIALLWIFCFIDGKRVSGDLEPFQQLCGTDLLPYGGNSWYKFREDILIFFSSYNT